MDTKLENTLLALSELTRTKPVVKIIRCKILVVPTESTFLRVDSKSQLVPWMQCGIHEKGMDFSSVADPWHFGMDPDPDPDPAIFVINLQDTNKIQIFNFLLITEEIVNKFLLIIFWRYIYIIFQR